MLPGLAALVLQASIAPVARDTAHVVGDTLVLPSLGVRFTMPELWMGRQPEGSTVLVPGAGRFGCQIMELKSVPLERRVVTGRRLLYIDRNQLGYRQMFGAALDAVLSPEGLVAWVDPFNRNCLAPVLQLHVRSSPLPPPDSVASMMQRAIDQTTRGVRRVVTDSAGWQIARLSWTEDKTDFIHPATVELWSRVVGGRTLVLAIMDAWTGVPDLAAFLASFRTVARPPP